MCVDDDGQVFWRAARERSQVFGESSFASDAVHLCVARRPLVAHSRLDEYALARGLDVEAVRVEAHAVLFVRRRDALPERTRHDAEHRAPVEAKLGVGHDLNAVFTELHQASSNEMS